MRIAKLISFFVVCVACQQCLSTICVNTSKQPEFSAGILFRGYELAFEDSNFSDYKFLSANNNATYVNQLQKMTLNTCSVVLGFVISHECFIAGPILKKNQIIGLSTTCSHDDIGKFFPFFYSAHPPVSKQIDKIVEHFTKTPNLGKIFVVYQPTEIYSMVQYNQFKKKFTADLYTEIPIDMDAKFDRNKFSLPFGKDVTIVFFTYPLPSIKILVEMSNYNLLTKNIRVFGNASWAESSVILQPLRSILKNVKEAYIIDILDWNKVKNSAFVQKFRRKFKRDPLNAEILNYDITQFAIKCYNKSLVNKKFKTEKFRQCITHTKFNGVSGVFSFSSQSSFVERQLYLTNILDHSYTPRQTVERLNKSLK